MTELRPLQSNLQMTKSLTQWHKLQMMLLSNDGNQMPNLFDSVSRNGVRSERMQVVAVRKHILELDQEACDHMPTGRFRQEIIDELKQKLKFGWCSFKVKVDKHFLERVVLDLDLISDVDVLKVFGWQLRNLGQRPA